LLGRWGKSESAHTLSLPIRRKGALGRFTRKTAVTSKKEKKEMKGKERGRYFSAEGAEYEGKGENSLHNCGKKGGKGDGDLLRRGEPRRT